ncbi:MAG: DUF2442 domain-containing protein [Clostridiales bacterium]|nr:DUF2442 domain-containing protein [Clostridiales bacterium]
MKDSKLDFTRFFPEVYQAVAGEDYTVYAYLNDGSMRMLDMKPFIEKGGVFEVLKNETVFRERLTVINYTVAWDMKGNRDEYECIDIDPFIMLDCPVVDDIPQG